MANGTGSLGLGVEDGLGETSSPLPSAAPVDEVPGATAFPLPPAAPVDEVPGATAFPLPPAAPVDEVPGATAFPLPSAAPVDEGLGATAAPLRSAAPASPLRPAAPAPAPGVPPTPDGSAGRHGLPGSRTDSVANGGDSGSQARGVGVFEGLGATSSPPRLAAPPSRVPLAPDASGRGAGGGVRDICNEFVERLVAGGLLDPGAIDVRLRTLLEEHFVRFLEERTRSSQTRRRGSIRRLQNIKTRKRSEKLKEEKMMESFKAILSDSISFLFPTMVAVFASNFSFGEYEKCLLILLCALGGLLILLAMVLSHGVDDGQGRTVVVSHLTLGAVIYIFGMLVYCLYKFFPEGSGQVMALYGGVAHFVFGAVVLTILWATSFKLSS
nr:translation initiation factor IF-2 isoform X2 [Aegilops tauschii subsp. strangulata]